jgi:hypothetical protein
VVWASIKRVDEYWNQAAVIYAMESFHQSWREVLNRCMADDPPIVWEEIIR